jgi:hypothetical protein
LEKELWRLKMPVFDPFAPDYTPPESSQSSTKIFDPYATDYKPPLTAGGAISGAASRLIPSVGEQIGGVFHQIAHPIETATDVYHLVKGLSLDLEDKYREKMGIAPLPPVESQKTSKAFRDYYKENYGSLEGFKQHLAQDPGAVLGDMSMIFTGGESALARLPAAARTAEIAARVTNPLSAITEPAGVAARTIGKISPFGRPPAEVGTALERLQQQSMPVDLPRAVTAQSPAVQAGGVALARAPMVGTPLLQAGQAVPAQIGGHIEDIAGKFSPAMAPNIVGGGIEQTLSQAGTRERAAAEAQAQAEHAAALRQWEQQNQAREQAINARESQVATAAEQRFGNVEPNQMAENAINAVQERHNRLEGENQINWQAVNNLDAHTEKTAFNDLHSNIEKGLNTEGVTLDPVKTPNAWSMMQDMRRLSGEAAAGAPVGIPPRLMAALENTYGKGQIPPQVLEELVPGSAAAMTPGKDPQFRLMGRHAPDPNATTVPVQGLDELRKRVGEMAFDATSNTDRRASNAIKSLFGDFLDNTLENHLAPGSNPNARAVIQKAIDSHRDFRERFGYNTSRLRGEDRTAAKTLNLMATGDIGPEAIAQNLVGSGKPGTRPGSAPLHDAIMNAVENPAAVRANMRGAYFNALTEGKTPRAIASNMDELRNTRMGQTLFEPNDHGLLRNYADIRQQTPEALRAAAIEARASTPQLAKVEPGKAEQIAKRVVGRNRSDEDVLGTLDHAFHKDGDIKTAARTWGKMTDANRDEFRGAWLRQLGGGGENFSLAKFVTNWDRYSDQAKAILLRDRGHRQNLQDFYTIAKQYKDAVEKYGNPSGTAQVTAWHRLAEGATKGVGALLVGHFAGVTPLAGMMVAGLGLRRVAGLLATPQGAAQVGRWNRLAKAYQATPDVRTLNMLQATTRSLNEQK